MVIILGIMLGLCFSVALFMLLIHSSSDSYGWEPDDEWDEWNPDDDDWWHV